MAQIKATAHVDDSNNKLKLALQWHARHTVVRNWCTRELKEKLDFDYPDLDDGIADISYDTPEYLPSESGISF
jgi:hypothetical protein